MLFVFLKYTLIHIPEIINNKKRQAYPLQQSKSLDETQQYFKSLLQAFVVVKRLQENGIFNFFFSLSKNWNDSDSCYVWLPFLVWSFLFVLAKMYTLGVLGLFVLWFCVEGLSTAVIQVLVFTTSKNQSWCGTWGKGNLAYVCAWIKVQSLNAPWTESDLRKFLEIDWFPYLLGSVYVRVRSCFSNVRLSVTLRALALQVLLSMGFSRQEYWSGLPCPPPGVLPDPGFEPGSLMSPA